MPRTSCAGHFLFPIEIHTFSSTLSKGLRIHTFDMKTMRPKILLLSVLATGFMTFVHAQQPEPPSKFSSWLPYQAIPSIMVISHPGDIPFAFEWEATPLLYSFGMTRKVSPWHSMFVIQPARFTGSIELKVTGQVSTRKTGRSYFGSSTQLIGHIPLIERGEYLGLNVGMAKYAFAGSSPWFKVVGVTTLFGFVEFNFKHSSDPEMWMGTIEWRFF